MSDTALRSGNSIAMLRPILQPHEPPKRVVYSVSELNSLSKNLLESNLSSLWLQGEISNLVIASSGHWYFSLKDAKAQLRCALFRFKAQTISFIPKDGDQVVVKGKVSLYEARGDYQLIADYMEPAGLGQLQQKLNQLMVKLNNLGLFDQASKKPLPYLPKRLALVTSPGGAALHDVLTVLARRCPMLEVTIYPTQVQGAKAADSIIEALDKVEARNDCDLVLLTRGGGSLEDLWCFNEESLAYRVKAMKLPIVVAVGHEIDTSIAELVADLRAPTPSAAAELIVPEQHALQQKLDFLNLAMTRRLLENINRFRNRLTLARAKLSDPQQAIAWYRHRIDLLVSKLRHASEQRLTNKRGEFQKLEMKLMTLNPKLKLQGQKERLARLEQRLEMAILHGLKLCHHQFSLQVSALQTLSPLSTLARGYAIAKLLPSHQLISSVDSVTIGSQVEIILKDGQLVTEVLQVTKSHS